MKLTGIRLLLAISLLLVNYNSQTVLAATDAESDSSVASESAASESAASESAAPKESIELEENAEPAPINKGIVSDKITLEPKKAHAGEQIAFKLMLPEDQNFATIILTYFSSNTKAELTVALAYNSETERYEGELETNRETGIGTWSLTKVVGIEKNNVSHVLETRALATEESVLKEGAFEVIPHPAALFDLSSLKVEPNTVKVGEKLQVSLHSAKDDLLTNGTVAYRSLSVDGETSDQQLLLSLTFNEKTKAYQGEMSSIANQLVGDWVIEYISVVDHKGNLFSLYNRSVIELDQAKLQERIAELNKQLLEEQLAEKVEEADNQSEIDLLKEEIKQLETAIEAKKELFQADLSMGNFTVQEDLAEESPDLIAKELPSKNEEEEDGTSEAGAFSLLTEPDAIEHKETVSASRAVENSLPPDEQKEADTGSVTNQKKAAIKETAQTVDESAVGAETETDEKTEATGFMQGSLVIVLVAFVIINGFIFKF